MTKKLYLGINFLLFLMAGTYVSYGQAKANNSITFIQGDNTFEIINNTDSIILNRGPFSLRYFCKQYNSKKKLYYGAQIAVLDNPSDTLILRIGQKSTEIQFFGPGTSMAAGRNGKYDTIFIGNIGHHSLIYENESSDRVSLISKNKNTLELEWKISAAFYNGKDVQFSDLDLTYLFFVVFIDKNLNEIIDSGEMKIVKVKFR